MDERKMHKKVSMRRLREMVPQDRARPYGFQMAGGREHSILAVEGSYRCPHCRRVDTAERSDMNLSRR